MKSVQKKALFLCVMLLTAAVLFVSLAPAAQAGTAVYVGRAVSADGTTSIAKSNDYQAVWANRVALTERVENEPDRTMPVNNEGTVRAPIPATTFRYTPTPWMESAAAARIYVTAYCSAMQTQAFNDAGEPLNAVRWYMSANSNTMKNGRNPETHEVIDELKPVDPLKIDLDASAYGVLPDPDAENGAENDEKTPNRKRIRIPIQRKSCPTGLRSLSSPRPPLSPPRSSLL